MENFVFPDKCSFMLIAMTKSLNKSTVDQQTLQSLWGCLGDNHWAQSFLRSLSMVRQIKTYQIFHIWDSRLVPKASFMKGVERGILNIANYSIVRYLAIGFPCSRVYWANKNWQILIDIQFFIALFLKQLFLQGHKWCGILKDIDNLGLNLRTHLGMVNENFTGPKNHTRDSLYLFVCCLIERNQLKLNGFWRETLFLLRHDIWCTIAPACTQCTWPECTQVGNQACAQTKFKALACHTSP